MERNIPATDLKLVTMTTEDGLFDCGLRDGDSPYVQFFALSVEPEEATLIEKLILSNRLQPHSIQKLQYEERFVPLEDL